MLTLPCLALLTRLFCVLCVMSGVVGGGEDMPPSGDPPHSSISWTNR